MPRSSRSKSHKQSKHNSKEAVKEHSDPECGVVKLKERSSKEEVSSVRVSKDYLSGEKRDFRSLSKDGKDLFGNGDLVDDYVVLKRRKEKVESDGLVLDKGVKVEKLRGKEMKESVDLKSRSRRRHENGGERKVDVEKEESKSSGRGDSKRKSEKDRKECMEIQEKDRGGLEKVKRGEVGKDGEVVKKQRSHSGDISEDRPRKRGREVADGVQNPALEKELKKKVRSREDDPSGKDKHQYDLKNYDDKRYSRGDGFKDSTHKDERHKDKYQEDDDKDIRHREDKFQKDGDRESRYRDAKYRENAEKDIRHRDEKYIEDSYRDNKHQNNKCRKDGDRDTRRKLNKYSGYGDENDRHNGGKYREDDKIIQHKKEKHHEHNDRDSRHRDAERKIESDREKRAQDIKLKDEYTSKDHGSESEIKHVRNESTAADPNHSKSSNHDSSPNYDDQVSRYKDDKSRRRRSDKEDCSDFRYLSTHEQQSDVEEKFMGSGKVNIVTERGWSNSSKTDVDTSLDHSCRRNSPNSSTHAARDHYRVNPEESKHREYGYEERVQHNVNSSREFAGARQPEKRSSARPVEKYTQKDDNHFVELSGQKHHRSDAWVSPSRVVDRSPSSTSTERRHLNRSEIRRTLDTEESARRSGSFRDYSVREGKGGRDIQKEIRPVDEVLQADGDNISASSPFKRNSNSGNSRPLLPPTPRTGLDSPSPFGYSEDDTRGRSNNRHRRNSNSNTGRSHGNTWKGVPTWHSHGPNGFMPFQHVPPIKFHPIMQQFPPPPIFGLGPTMDLNNTLPFHMPDTERFPGHGRPLGWRNPVDDSCPPLNGWDANNAVFGDNTHGYGRLDLDQNRIQMSSQVRDTGADMWKGKNSGLSGDLPSISQKEDSGSANEVIAGQSSQQAQNELNQPNSQEDSLDVQSSDPSGNIISEAAKGAPDESHMSLEMSVKDNASHYHIYLSKLDISTDLTQPDLYNQLTSLINMDKLTAEEDKSKMIYVEEIFESKLADEIWTDAPFGAINDSVFQTAMSLYKNMREDIRAMNKMKVLSSNMEIPKVVQTYNNGKAHSDDNKPEKGVLASLYDAHPNNAVSDYDEEAEASPLTAFQKLDEPCVTDIVVVSKDQASVLNEMGMELGDTIMDNKSAMQVAELSRTLSLSNPEGMNRSDYLRGNLSATNNEDNKLVETKCAPMLYFDVSSAACEALMPELIESESVIISRIHHSPESTH